MSQPDSVRTGGCEGANPTRLEITPPSHHASAPSPADMENDFAHYFKYVEKLEKAQAREMNRTK